MTTPRDRETPRPQADGALVRPVLGAGIGSVVLLAALLVTSLARGPNPIGSAVLAAATLLLAVLVVHGALRRRGRRR